MPDLAEILSQAATNFGARSWQWYESFTSPDHRLRPGQRRM